MNNRPFQRPYTFTPRMRHERRILLFAFLTGFPGALCALTLIWLGEFTPKTQWTLAIFVLGGWWAFAAALHARVIYPLRTLSNMLSALREGDFSLRARDARPDDALGEVCLEINALGETLRRQRFDALEASALLRRIMAEIDVAVFTFDEQNKLTLVNQRGERLLGRPAARLINSSAAELGLDKCLDGVSPRTDDIAFPEAAGRWEIRRTTFRMDGRPRLLLVISDLTRTLREEERQAWKRLIQVLRHEINNSLTPIDSLADSLANLLAREPRPDDWDEDMREGLAVIRQRARSLNRFMTAYTKLTRLPQPSLRPVDVAPWINRVAGLETRLPVQVLPGPAAVIHADGDQLDQLLINLVHNAADAALETGGGARIKWRLLSDPRPMLEVRVEDDGPGLSNTENLFVPFFTTKPEGAGIGLALSRQIAESHGGRLALANRIDAEGCVASLLLPVEQLVSS